MDLQSNGIFISWGRANAGRDKQGVDLFNQFLGWLGEQQRRGSITTFTPVVLQPHGANQNGFILIQGDAQQMQKLAGDEVWNDYMIRGNVMMSGLTVVPAYLGTSLQNRVQLVAKYS